MNKDDLKKSLEIYLDYLNNISSNKNYIPTRLELDTLSSLYEETSKNTNLSNLMSLVSVEKEKDKRDSLINSFIDHQIVNNIDDKKELISKIYQTNINGIEHRVLQNGNEIFLFYDFSVGRKRIIKNTTNETLRKMVASDLKNDIEIEMVEISKLNPNYLLGPSLSKEGLNNIKLLFEKTKSLNLNWINVENQIVLDKNNNVFEAYYSDEEKISIISKPKEIIYEKENKNNSSIESNIEKEIEKEMKKSRSLKKQGKEKIYENIKFYYYFPEMINKIKKKERIFYERMIPLYASIEKKLENGSKKHTLNNPDIYVAGYVNIFFVSIITLAILFVLGIIYRLN